MFIWTSAHKQILNVSIPFMVTAARLVKNERTNLSGVISGTGKVEKKHLRPCIEFASLLP